MYYRAKVMPDTRQICNFNPTQPDVYLLEEECDKSIDLSLTLRSLL
jgi:hypothetical protein